MTILQLITRSELCGAEVFAAQLARGLAERGHDLALAAVYAPRSEGAHLPVAAEVRSAELGGRCVGRLERRPLAALLRLLAQMRPDVVQANGFHALKYASLARRCVRRPFGLVYRNISMASKWLNSPLQRAWGRWLLQPVDRVLSVSARAAEDFRAAYRFPAERIQVIPRGVEIPDDPRSRENRERVAALIDCPLHDPILCHVGRFTAEKNHAGLLQAFVRIRRQHRRARLVLCGDGPLRPNIEQEIAALGLAGRVHLLGSRPDASEILGGSDLLLLTSHVEGIPGVILEAAARRVPVVATNVGGVGEVIADGKTGRLAAADDMATVAAAANELLDDPSRRNRLAEAAHAFIVEHHAMSRAVDRFEKAYQAIVSDRCRPTASRLAAMVGADG